MRILIIEDDHDMALTLADNLKKNYIVEISLTGEDGKYKASENDYDLIILDYMLPNISGVEVCKKLRENQINTPILILTGRSTVEDKTTGLNAGADDYLTKPFSFEELEARIKALLRRPQQTFTSNVLHLGDLVLDLDKKTVERNGQIIRLRRKEFELLECLVKNAGRVMSRGVIIDHIWDSAYESGGNTVDVHIKYLRDSIDRPFDKRMIKTVHGFGYKIEA